MAWWIVDDPLEGNTPVRRRTWEQQECFGRHQLSGFEEGDTEVIPSIHRMARSRPYGKLSYCALSSFDDNFSSSKVWRQG